MAFNWRAALGRPRGRGNWRHGRLRVRLARCFPLLQTLYVVVRVHLGGVRLRAALPSDGGDLSQAGLAQVGKVVSRVEFGSAQVDAATAGVSSCAWADSIRLGFCETERRRGP